MKIKVTEIEATAEDLRVSNTLADAFSNLFRDAINPMYRRGDSYDNDDSDEGEN